MKSVMVHQFSQVPRANIPRSVFDRSHGHKTAFNSGYLVPVYVDEALPGDTFAVRMNAFARLSTPLAPIMDNIFMDSFFFAISYRHVWENWHKFNGAQDDPGDSTDYNVPTVTSDAVTGFTEGSLYDYFGLPTKVASLEVNNLHARAYNYVINEWFKDQNLQDNLVVDVDDGPDTVTDYVLWRRGKRHDYFTSSLPWPQKSDDGAVSLPLGTEAPIFGDNMDWDSGHDLANFAQVRDAAGASANLKLLETTPDYLHGSSSSSGTGELKVDLSQATAASINAFRLAIQTQALYERDARGGTRLVEIIKSHFGVDSPDHRMQRPEYLGGGSTPINIHPVAQTSETGTDQLGTMGAFGTAAINGHGFTKSFTEHCLILGLVNIRADLSYQQGLHRMWTRQTRWDYYWPGLARIGEQVVYSKEIYCDGTANDDDVFGYQERYAEYRYFPSKITGVLRSNATTSLDLWHLSQEFGSRPVLGNTFIQDNPPISRVVATPTEPEIIFDSYFKIKAARPMPVYGVPYAMARF